MVTIIKDKVFLRKPVINIKDVSNGEVLDTMKNIRDAYDERPGCQLIAAKQIGYEYDIARVKTGKDTSIFITDVTIKKDGAFKTSSEGSYSLTGRYHVKRTPRVVATYTELIPNEDYTGYKTRNVFEERITDVRVARIFQHLVDFNHGKLLCDTGRMYALVDKAQKGHFVEW